MCPDNAECDFLRESLVGALRNLIIKYEKYKDDNPNF